MAPEKVPSEWYECQKCYILLDRKELIESHCQTKHPTLQSNSLSAAQLNNESDLGNGSVSSQMEMDNYPKLGLVAGTLDLIEVTVKTETESQDLQLQSPLWFKITVPPTTVDIELMDDCSTSTSSRVNLINNKQKTTNSWKNCCPICYKVLSSDVSLRIHKKAHKKAHVKMVKEKKVHKKAKKVPKIIIKIKAKPKSSRISKTIANETEADESSSESDEIFPAPPILSPENLDVQPLDESFISMPELLMQAVIPQSEVTFSHKFCKKLEMQLLEEEETQKPSVKSKSKKVSIMSSSSVSELRQSEVNLQLPESLEKNSSQKVPDKSQSNLPELSSTTTAQIEIKSAQKVPNKSQFLQESHTKKLNVPELPPMTTAQMKQELPEDFLQEENVENISEVLPTAEPLQTTTGLIPNNLISDKASEFMPKPKEVSISSELVTEDEQQKLPDFTASNVKIFECLETVQNDVKKYPNRLKLSEVVPEAKAMQPEVELELAAPIVNRSKCVQKIQQKTDPLLSKILPTSKPLDVSVPKVNSPKIILREPRLVLQKLSTQQKGPSISEILPQAKLSQSENVPIPQEIQQEHPKVNSSKNILRKPRLILQMEMESSMQTKCPLMSEVLPEAKSSESESVPIPQEIQQNKICTRQQIKKILNVVPDENKSNSIAPANKVPEKLEVKLQKEVTNSMSKRVKSSKLQPEVQLQKEVTSTQPKRLKFLKLQPEVTNTQPKRQKLSQLLPQEEANLSSDDSYSTMPELHPEENPPPSPSAIALLVKCSYCPLKFSDKSEMILHRQEKHTCQKPHKCSECHAAFQFPFGLKSHLQKKRCKTILEAQLARRFPCDLCSTLLKTVKGLNEHMRVVHNVQKAKGVGVKETRKINHICLFCGYKAAGPNALEKHNRKHTGDKPFTCINCGASFSIKYNMKQHMKYHCPFSLEFQENSLEHSGNFQEDVQEYYYGTDEDDIWEYSDDAVENSGITLDKIHSEDSGDILEYSETNEFPRLRATHNFLDSRDPLEHTGTNGFPRPVNNFEEDFYGDAVENPGILLEENIHIQDSMDILEHSGTIGIPRLTNNFQEDGNTCACQFCPAVFAHPRGLAIHEQNLHGDLIGEFECQICFTRFVEGGGLGVHYMKVHNTQPPSEETGQGDFFQGVPFAFNNNEVDRNGPEVEVEQEEERFIYYEEGDKDENMWNFNEEEEEPEVDGTESPDDLISRLCVQDNI